MVFLVIFFRISFGASSSCSIDLIFASTKRLLAATRILKNSSKLLEKIPKKRKRSINGTDSSSASCKTLSLKDNQLKSRLIIGNDLVLGIIVNFYPNLSYSD